MTRPAFTTILLCIAMSFASCGPKTFLPRKVIKAYEEAPLDIVARTLIAKPKDIRTARFVVQVTSGEFGDSRPNLTGKAAVLFDRPGRMLVGFLDPLGRTVVTFYHTEDGLFLRSEQPAIAMERTAVDLAGTLTPDQLFKVLIGVPIPPEQFWYTSPDRGSIIPADAFDNAVPSFYIDTREPYIHAMAGTDWSSPLGEFHYGIAVEGPAVVWQGFFPGTRLPYSIHYRQYSEVDVENRAAAEDEEPFLLPSEIELRSEDMWAKLDVKRFELNPDVSDELFDTTGAIPLDPVVIKRESREM